MDEQQIQRILEAVHSQQLSVTDAMERLQDLPYTDLGYAKVDHHRSLRVGYGEVIYGAGKTTEQILGITACMIEKHANILITRVDMDVYEAVKEVYPVATYNALGRAIHIPVVPVTMVDTTIGIVTAGTSDCSVAEEAATTCEVFGNPVERFYDVGVAGIHRLLDKVQDLRNCKVLIVIAGMEGALPSVVAGLVDVPVIAVPTSVGYGAHLQGLTPLLAMLTSCASGVTVVNIDNGFGAAYAASMINHI